MGEPVEKRLPIVRDVLAANYEMHLAEDVDDALAKLTIQQAQITVLREALGLCVARMPDPPEYCSLKEEKLHDEMLCKARAALSTTWQGDS